MASTVIASALALVVLVAGGTYAYFSDTVSSTGNTFQTGTLKLTSARNDMPIEGPMFYTSTSSSTGLKGTGVWYPGKSVSRILMVENDGSIDARLNSVLANVRSTNATQEEINKFSRDVNVSVYVLRGGNLRTSTEAYKDALEAGDATYTAWLLANSEATEEQKLAKMTEIYNAAMANRGLPTGWNMESSTLKKYMDGNVRGGILSNGAPRVPLAQDETVALVYVVSFTHNMNTNQNALQDKIFDIDFVHEFVQK